MKPWTLRVIAAAALLAALLLTFRLPEASRQEISFALTCSEVGQALLHGLPFEGVSYRMPGSSLLAAWLSWQNPIGWEGFAWFCDIAQALLLAGLAWQLRGPAGSILALLLAWGLRTGTVSPGDYPQRVVSLLVLTVAGLLVWTRRSPSPRRFLALAASCGASLLLRSTLVFFPPLMAAFVFLREPRSKNLRKSLLILLIAPYLALLPWIFLNARIHGRFIPLELGQADLNVVTGALGLVQTVEGNVMALLPKSMNSSSSKLPWAAREALGHPLRTLRAFLSRLSFVFSLNPWLCVLAGLGFWRARHHAPFRWLAFLALSHVVVHCLMSVQENYFLPLWPLLIALSCGLLPEKVTGEYESDSGSWPALVGLCLALSAALAVGWLCLLYPSRTCAADAWARAAAKSPEDPWLLLQNGSRLLEKNLPREALPLLRQAAVKRPDLPKHSLYLAWAYAQLGKPLALLNWRQKTQNAGFAFAQDRELELTAKIWRASILLRRLPERARAELREALALNASDALVRGPHGPAEKKVLARLKSSETPWMLGRLDKALLAMPPERHLALLEELSLLADPPLKNDFLRQAAILHLRANQRKRGLALLQQAAAADLALTAELRLLLAQDFREAGRFAQAQEILSPLLKQEPSAAVWLEQAAVFIAAGRIGEAREALNQAASPPFKPEPEDFQKISFSFQNGGHLHHAVVFLELATGIRPGQAAFWSDLGVCRHLSGDSPGAIEALKQALLLEPRHWPAALTLGAIHSARGEPSQALKVYEEALARRAPLGPDPAWELLRRQVEPADRPQAPK